MPASLRALKSPQGLMKKVRRAFEKADAEIKLHHYKVRNFTPNLRLELERGDFIVKTAENGAELEACLKLRYEVFHKEYRHKTREIGIDVDRLDYICDHLMIVDRRQNRVIGTYRLNSSLFSRDFYSESEFQMSRVLNLSGTKLELGRACIDRSHRTGVVIALLWRGIAEYMRRSEAAMLFGCSSIKTMDPMEIAMITKYLSDRGHLTHDLDVRPTRKYEVRQLPHLLDYLASHPEAYDENRAQELLPPLFKSYLKMGAKLCGAPALDRDYFCIDYLTLIKTDQFNDKMKEKYDLKTS